MASFSKRVLGGSTDGKAIKVTGINSAAAVTVHTGDTATATIDEVWIYANNTSASDVKLTLEWGTATAADGNIELTIAAESGLVLVIPGLILQNAMVVKAFAATANVVMIHGYVNRITA